MAVITFQQALDRLAAFEAATESDVGRRVSTLLGQGLTAAQKAAARANIGAAARDEVVLKRGAQTVSGDVTFERPVGVPAGSIPQDRVTDLTADLASKLDAADIAGKADDNAVVKLTGDQTKTGVLTLSSAPVVPDASFAQAKVVGLVADLAGKADDAAVVKLAGAQTVTGAINFTAAPTVPDGSFTQAKVANLTTDLAAKAADNAVVKLTGDQTVAGVKTFSSAPVVPDGSFTTKKVQLPEFYSRDYVTPGTGDAYAGLVAMFAAAHGGSTVGVHGARVILEPGEFRISQTLDLTQWSGIIEGSGGGISPSYGTGSLPGRGTVIRWNGPADEPMIRVRDSRDLIIQNLRIEGLDTAIPSYGIEFNNPGAATSGSNEYITVRDVHIGIYPWTVQGTNKGKVKNGIGWTGTNANNDQFRVERVQIYGPTEWAVVINNTQSVGGTFRNLAVNMPGVGCVKTAATIRLDDPEFYNYPLGIETTDTANVYIDNIKAEFGDTLARMYYSSALYLRGGRVQVQNVQTGSGVFIDAYPSHFLRLKIHDLDVSGLTDPSLARIEIGAVSAYNGRFMIDVHNCNSMSPDQLVFPAGASMWEPSSKGTVQWQSVYGTTIHHFRNELRHTSQPIGRATLDRTAWDMPVPFLEGTVYRLPWNGSAWTWHGQALTARPSARTDVYFDLYGAPAATADPAWMLANDSRTDV